VPTNAISFCIFPQFLTRPSLRSFFSGVGSSPSFPLFFSLCSTCSLRTIPVRDTMYWKTLHRVLISFPPCVSVAVCLFLKAFAVSFFFPFFLFFPFFFLFSHPSFFFPFPPHFLLFFLLSVWSWASSLIHVIFSLSSHLTVFLTRRVSHSIPPHWCIIAPPLFWKVPSYLLRFCYDPFFTSHFPWIPHFIPLLRVWYSPSPPYFFWPRLPFEHGTMHSVLIPSL